MAELGKRDGGAAAAVEEEERLLMEEVTLLDIDMLCSAVALQAQKGKWGKLNGDNDDDGEEEDIVCEYNQYGGGVFRMWEGELVHDCLDDRRIALQSTCCPCYRFGKNMKRAGFGSCFLQVNTLSNTSGLLMQGSDSSLNDCVYHLICPCCTLCQESRTLEMNNVEDGIWHGRGDTICIGSYSEDVIPCTKSPDFLSMQKTSNDSIHLSTSVVEYAG
ncbi:hypothetical protein BUALT_Bualt03G0066200 [Buddleja alternifolia]|uniref:PLAC8 family protein n=1 Tax=Buddleja alternifolia TaxID=168488 RepID=A0AAV6XRJ2_9LAMI|nr:hypothetical protein BUALT_Bualt03G0066200 [Buddleja alternifolia]